MRENVLFWFLISATRDTWVSRMDAAAGIIERTYAVDMNVVHGGTKFKGTTKTIANRQKYLLGRLKPAFRGTGIHGPIGLQRTEHGAIYSDRFSFGGQMVCIENDVFQASAWLPDQLVTEVEDVFGKLGDVLEAYSGYFLPMSLFGRLRDVQFRAKCIGWRPRPTGMTSEEAHLPVLREDKVGQRSPFQPVCFGWLNYWSSDVCEYVGFPETAGSVPRLHCQRTPSNAWLVRLGDEPLQPVDEHMTLLREAYAAFPKVGERFFGSMSEQVDKDRADDAARSTL